MSKYIITDGAGAGYSAKVTSSNNLKCDSIITDHITHESIDDGTAFIIATDFITLTTTASYSALLYIKNTDSQRRHFHIQQFRVCAGLCAAASSLQVQVYLNDTAGTIISDEALATTSNLNTEFTANVFGGVAYKGNDAKTATGGSYYTQFINHAPGHSLQDYKGAFIIGYNDSITIQCKPEVAMTACIELLGYFEEH